MESLKPNQDSSSSTTGSSSSYSYKLRKEQFVYGLEGTTPSELLFLCSTTFIGIVIYYRCFYCRRHLSQQTQQRSHFVRNVAGEVVCFIIPMIICQTIWIYPYGIVYVTMELWLSLFLLYLERRSAHTTDDTNGITAPPVATAVAAAEIKLQEIQNVTITIYRGCILLLTIISILGIDFHIYPRRFGKTEITGYSLMDLGAASFIIMAAISSARRYNQRPSEQPTTTTTAITAKNQSPTKKQSTVPKQLQKMIPLLVMGTIRLITHKGIEYPEHNSEYGIHWNFFFTLAFIIPTTSVIKSYIDTSNKKPNWIRPLLIFGVYQYILSVQNLQDFIVHAPRTCPTTATALSDMARRACDLWYANREGIVGCIAFTALYLFGDYIAYTYFWNYDRKKCITDPSTRRCHILVWETTKPLWFTVMALFASWQILTAPSFFNLVSSRRSTNTVFCIWVLFVNVFQFVSIYTLVLLCNRLVMQPPYSSLQLHAPLILSSINRNGLYIFIIANLFTGIINLSMDTLSVSNPTAICIIMLYVGIVGFVSMLLDHFRSNNLSRRSSSQPEVHVVNIDKEK